MSATSYGDITPRTAGYAERKMLAHAGPVTVLPLFALNNPLPKNKTNVIKFRRPTPFAALTVPLAEGVTPTVGSMAYEDVSLTLKQWGAVYGITDVIEDTHEDPVLNDMTMLAGEQAEKTLEAVTWGKIKAGTTVYYANGTQRTDVNTAISINDIRKAVRYLQAMKGRKFTTILSGSPDFNTTPIEAAYVAVTHTDMQADIRNLAGFTPVSQYGSMKPLCAEEFGTVEDVRFVTSPELSSFPDAGGLDGDAVVSTTGTNADVYPVVILAKEAFGCVPLKGMGAITPIVLNPGKPDKSDQLGQRGYVGWKAYFEAVVLNQTWMVRVEAAASVLS